MSCFVAIDKALQFDRLEIYLDQEIGSGAYGEVFRAKCDHLPCAAKVISIRRERSASWKECMSKNNYLSSLSNTSGSSDGGIEDVTLKNFMRECDILKRMQHPCIIQYLAMATSPDDGQVAVVMELASQSLTQLLHRRRHLPLPLQLQFVNDTALAINYLHQNHIIHCDISSNNVLVVGNSKTKLSDFGTSAVLEKDGSGRLHQPIPGTEAYMPPEAFPTHPALPVSYSYQLDCFAFGVLSLQIITGKFPRPASMRKRIGGEPGAGLVWKTLTEVERRKSHLDLVQGTHPLLQLVLQCIMDKEASRPSTDFICHELERIIRSHRLTETDSASMDNWLQQKDTPQINDSSYSDESSYGDTSELFRSIPSDLQEEKCPPEQQSFNMASYVDVKSKKEHNPKWSVKWREEEETIMEEKVQRGNCISHKDKLFLNWNRVISCYKHTTGSWHEISRNAYLHSSLVVIKGLLTTVGGRTNSHPRRPTSALRSLTKECRWSIHFPAMLTKRYNFCAVQFDGGIIIAGGKVAEPSDGETDQVEILDLETMMWSQAAPFPKAFSGGSMAISHGVVFAVGEQSLFHCSLGDLINSSKTSFFISLQREWRNLVGSSSSNKGERQVWTYSSHCPLHNSTLISIHDNLVAVGGTDKTRKPRNFMHRYDMWSNKWEDLSPMGVARYRCLAGVITQNSSRSLIVIGGCGSDHAPCCNVEIADIISTCDFKPASHTFTILALP